MKRYLFLIFAVSFVTETLAVDLPVRLGVIGDIHLKGVGVGVTGSICNRTFFYLVSGVSSNFTEPAWNDLFITIKGHYRVLQRKHLAIPIGLMTGYKYINNYEEAFSSVHAGLYSGIDWQFNSRQAVAIHAGLKYGKQEYKIERRNIYGTVSYLETFREPLFYLSCNYLFLF